MRLATIENGTRDGQLVVVSRDNARAVTATGIADNLLDALDRWDAVEPALKNLAEDLENGTGTGAFETASAVFLAPLPRTWQWLDGSAYDSHGELLQKVFKSDPAPTDRPLMYQGVSDTFYSATQDIPFPSEADGIDFEGEFGVIVDRVPMGTSAADAVRHMGMARDAIGPESSINYRPLLAMLKQPPWHVGRIGMIGDAVHATTPHLASGAGLAIEDGLILGEMLAEATDVEEAWSLFEARRWDRARLVVENSLRISRIEQEGGGDEEIQRLMGESSHALAKPY